MDFQQIATLFLVAIAAFFLARRLWRQAQGKGDGECGGCGGACGKPVSAGANAASRPAPQATPLITLGGASGNRPAPPPRFRPPKPNSE